MRPSSDTRPIGAAQDSAVLLRMSAVTRFIGLGRSTIYRLMAESRFPTPVRLSTRAIAWRRSDLERWSAERPPASH